LSSIHEDLAREEVAALVCATLRERGISVVLSGGAVVSIYSDNEYESFDLDFVHTGLARKVDEAMKELGFERKQRHWRHPRTDYWVEFSSGPVAIGEEKITEFAARETDLGVLHLLPPTECVMDRLAWYFHSGDVQCLEQAVGVARKHPVDLRRIEAWSEGEMPHGEARYREFVRHLFDGSTGKALSRAGRRVGARRRGPRR
jgi:hypothetical protein